ncbi:MAG: N-acetyltransferase [Nitrosospira sp.]|nr:N-acetyltransferase [Nitrosospira sp.]
MRPVTNYREMGVFIDLPWRIYADDPMWVPPLRLERRLHFSRFNSFFKHGEWQAWIAYRNNQPVGRISAQVDQLHRQHHGADTGHFGSMECVDDTEVCAALVGVAEAWLAARHTRHVSGPFNLSINQECGILVDGFDTPPMVMMPHSPKWYGRLLEEQGYQPVKDLLAYWVDVDFEVPRVMRSLIGKFSKHIKLRTLRMDNFSAEMEILRDIFNDAWSENWGFIPFTEAEFAELGSSLRLLVPEYFIQIAEVDGVPAAFMVGLPNLNEIFAKLDGSLFPFGWLRLIRWFRDRAVRTGRIPLMGVRKQFQNTPLGMALAFMVIDEPRQSALSAGIKEVEMSWILEDNKAMRSILDLIGSRQYKRYRIYGKTL